MVIWVKPCTTVIITVALALQLSALQCHSLHCMQCKFRDCCCITMGKKRLLMALLQHPHVSTRECGRIVHWKPTISVIKNKYQLLISPGSLHTQKLQIDWASTKAKKWMMGQDVKNELPRMTVSCTSPFAQLNQDKTSNRLDGCRNTDSHSGSFFFVVFFGGELCLHPHLHPPEKKANFHHEYQEVMEITSMVVSLISLFSWLLDVS